MRRAVTAASLTLLVVVDLVLIAWLIGWMGEHNQTTDASSAPASPASSAPGDALTPTGAVSVVASGDTVLRLTEGTCVGDGRPMLEMSPDNGATFTEVPVPVLDPDAGPAGAARTLLAARASSPTEITIVAGDLDCTARGFTTTDGGLTWTEAPSDDWYVDASHESIVGPDGPVEPGCTIRSLSVFSPQNVKVLCADGSINGTNDAGETWVVLGGLTDATAATLMGLFDGYGIASRPECASQVMRTGDAGATWTAVGCIDPATEVVSMSGAADRLVAATATQSWYSTDGGVTWVAAGQEPADG